MRLNAKGRPFSWSYTALTNYEGCPMRYAAEKFYCTTPFKETEPIRYGNRVHKAAEMALLKKSSNDPEAEAPVRPYVETMLKSGWHIEPELEIALTRDFKPIKWFSKLAWFRIKLDVVLTNSDHSEAKYFDFKTGAKIREDQDQLRIGVAALSVVRPHITKFDGKLIWTKHRATTGMSPVTKDQIPDIWQGVLQRVGRMEQAWEKEMFPAWPSPLCGWCAVSTCVLKQNKRNGGR